MSAGPGRCQRAILAALKKSPEHSMTRRELQALLVNEEGYFSTNVLRAIKALHRMRCIGITEGRSLDDTLVSLPRPVKAASEKLIFELLNGTKR